MVIEQGPSRRRGVAFLGIVQSGVWETCGPFVELRRPGSTSAFVLLRAAQLISRTASEGWRPDCRVPLLCGKDGSMLIIRLLGGQAVLDGATGRIRTGSSRTLALLGVLIARTGRPQDRAVIAGQFWPESGDGQALTNLRRKLHDLRGILGEDDSLEITPGQLCWHDRGRHDIDLGTFLRESAAAEGAHNEVVVTHGSSALERYGGPLLPGLDDEWLDPLRNELE